MLTLEEMENISFHKGGMSGYKREEVDDFVDAATQKVKALELANKELEARVDQLNRQLLDCKEKEESVTNALITANQAAKTVITDAEKKADSIVAAADVKAAQIVAEAERKAADKLAEAEAKASVMAKSAVSVSARSVEENNQIIASQKVTMVTIQNEVARFKDALADTYREHIKLINNMPSREELELYQTRLQEAYPQLQPVMPDEAAEELHDITQKVIAGKAEDFADTAPAGEEEALLQALAEGRPAPSDDPKPQSIDEVNGGDVFGGTNG